MRKVIFLIFSLILLLPDISFATNDPRCFSRADCEIARKNNPLITEAEAKEGHYLGPDAKAACGETNFLGEEVGFCLPASKTITNISFGGKRQFTDIGDFIATIYQYSVGVIGIIAVLMIIVGGVQWIVAGGSKDTILSAKKKIVSSVTGLTIAALSYVILNTINPALVNLRLPQTWIIKPQVIAPTYCSGLPESTTKLIKVEPKGAKLSEEAAKKLVNGSQPSVPPSQATCGFAHVVDGDPSQTCLGDACAGFGSVCAPTKDLTGACKPGLIGGTISGLGNNARPLQANEDAPNIIDEVNLHFICGDGSVGILGTDGGTDSNNHYFIKGNKPAGLLTTLCNGHDDPAQPQPKGEPLGFFLGVDVNDEESIVGTGTDDWYAIGQRGKNSHKCDINIAKIAYGLVEKKTPTCDQLECTCSTMSLKPFNNKLATTPSLARIRDYLIPLEDMKKGYVCDINISRIEFPDVADNEPISAVDAAKLLAGGALGVISAFFPPAALAAGFLTADGLSGISLSNIFTDPTACDKFLKGGYLK